MQALADFFAETSDGEEIGIWKIFIDDSSTRNGSGVGVLLLSPQGNEIQVEVQFYFRASNNEVEYEVLLASL